MKAFIAAIILITATSAFADVKKIIGLDAQNMCSAIRSIYKLQTSQLSDYPLSQVVQLKVEKNSVDGFVLGTEDESITCTTKNIESTLADNDSDVLKVVYNSEVSSFDTDRSFASWSYEKAFNLQGKLAETVCSQLEMFNTTEEQAQVPPSDQVLTSLNNPLAENLFGLVLTVSLDRVFSCGSIGSVKTFQIHSLDGW
jgi:hypothetical protein